jgi:putative hydrolase of the HAD superfamily
MGDWQPGRWKLHSPAMNITTVIFDRDNTLLSFDRAAVARLERRIADVAPQLPPGAAPAHWATWPGPWPRTPAEEPGFWRAFWRTLAEHHTLPPAAAAGLMAIGDFYHTCFAAFPDAAACIESLRLRGFRLAVLTNFELPSIDRTLAHAGIDPRLFDVLVSSAGVGAQKPHPRAYQAVLDELGEAPGACLFVDDLPVNVAGARDAGLHALLLDRAGRFSGEPGRISHLGDLVAGLSDPKATTHRR